MRFDVSANVLLDLFSISTTVGEYIVADGVYLRCLIFLSHTITFIDLVELNMLKFYGILGIY